MSRSARPAWSPRDAGSHRAARPTVTTRVKTPPVRTTPAKTPPVRTTPVRMPPAVKYTPNVKPPKGLRPGVGIVPSGTRQPDRGKHKDFVPAAGSYGRTVVWPPTAGAHKRPVVTTHRPPTVTTYRPPAVTTHRPPAVTTHRPPVVTTHRPSVVSSHRRPSIHQRPVVAYKPTVYRSTWNRRTPFTPTWYKTASFRLPSRRSRYYYPWLNDHGRRPAGYWWTRATLTALNAWMHHRWDRPVYYVYGAGGNVFYSGSYVFVDNARYATADQYYLQARAIALAVPALDDVAAARLEWYPLGVFAVTQPGVAATQSYFQLAVTREGWLSGTYYNEATGTSRPLQGSVDQASQRAAWTFADGQNTDYVVETSFSNLTLDQVPTLVHFGPNQAQESLLVRVSAPAG